MTPKERQPDYRSRGNDPLYPNELPPELADFLKDRSFACVTQATNLGTFFIVKMTSQEIQSARGRVPVRVQHELYDCPTAPVIRSIITIWDQPRNPLALETFINVQDRQQRADFAALASQKDLYLLFYDEGLNHALSKRVRNGPREVIARILNQADQLLAAIPKERFDFDRAKEAVMRQTSL